VSQGLARLPVPVEVDDTRQRLGGHLLPVTALEPASKGVESRVICPYMVIIETQ
jgi:hypothetical protein